MKCPHCLKEIDNVLEDKHPRLCFGKYCGRTYREIAIEDPRYLKWMYDNLDLNPLTQERIETAMAEAGEDL